MPRPEPFHPDIRAARWLPRGGVSPRTLRLFRKPPRPLGSTPDVEVSTVLVRTTGGARPYRMYRPRSAQGPVPAFFWIHGGGLVMGTPQQDDRFLIGLASRLGIVVIAASYRLAPEHPAPAALDDIHSGWHEVRARAGEFGIDHTRIALGGASAGGGLAAALTHRLHDDGAAEPVFQLLVYPMLDDRTVLRTDIDTRHVRIWPPSSNRFGWESYLGAPAGSPDVAPYSVPARREDLSGLPPAWIGVGTLDLFHGEDLAYARRLLEAGVTTEVLEVPGVFHGFDAVFRNAGVTAEFHRRIALAFQSGLELGSGGK
ncbi:MAG: alpha/beta hydrolase [Microbacterium sp.]